MAAVVLLALLAIYGVRPSSEIEEFLKSPSALDTFAAAMGERSSQGTNQVSPLVRQAADFARYLNPPPPPPPPPSEIAAESSPAPPVPVAVKFDLVGVCYYALHPEKSFAFIDEPGKGLNWVKQGDSIGHIKIEKINDGSITVKDGQKTSEMTVKIDESWKNLLKSPPGGPAAAYPPTSPRPAATVVPASATPARPTPGARARPDVRRAVRPGAAPATHSRGLPPAASPAQVKPAPGNAPPQMAPVPTPEQPAQANTEQGIASSPAPSEKDIIRSRLAEDVKASKITPEEAKRMEELAETLEQLEELQRQKAGEQSERSEQQAAEPPPMPSD